MCLSSAQNKDYSLIGNWQANNNFGRAIVRFVWAIVRFVRTCLRIHCHYEYYAHVNSLTTVQTEKRIHLLSCLVGNCFIVALIKPHCKRTAQHYCTTPAFSCFANCFHYCLYIIMTFKRNNCEF